VSVSRIRIVQLEDGRVVFRGRSGRDREGLNPREKAVSETFDQLAGEYLSGELSTGEIYAALNAAQDELDRRQP
jgi:hypothetical protein